MPGSLKRATPWLVVTPPRRHLHSLYRATASGNPAVLPSTRIGPLICLPYAAMPAHWSRFV